MPLTPDWLAGQGDDAFLLYFVSVLPEIERASKIGVAVSGGSDSMALLHLLVRFGRQVGIGIEAVTVDHGLRPEAKDEAAFVAENCAALGVGHDVLQWRRGSKTGNLQDQAARGRYALMSAWAKERGISAMATGHTADDQAETFLMQLARRAGIDGLSGMAQVWSQDAVTWCRPLLLHRRHELRAYLNRNGITWVDDPTNDNPRYERVRVRRLLPQLASVGLDADVLADVTIQLASVKSALDAFCQMVTRDIVTQIGGDLILDRPALIATPSEVRRRLLIAALRWVSGSMYPPRSTSQFALEFAIHSCQTKTLSGCRIVSTPHCVRISRETNAVRNLSTPTDQAWDNRWHLAGGHDPALTIRALGDVGIRQCPDWRTTGIPRQSLLSSPSVWHGDTLIAAPLAGKPEGWTAHLATDFHDFLVSH
jgi:tRNA(Ile)-lysidine synthase